MAHHGTAHCTARHGMAGRSMARCGTECVWHGMAPHRTAAPDSTGQHQTAPHRAANLRGTSQRTERPCTLAC
eukprot:3962219-Alexandrium_andersonii.AAC.1